MPYDYDLITIGLGPAGMAVSAMASQMGLKVCAVEKNKVGGECMNVGCIPSKALLRISKIRSIFDKLDKMELTAVEKPALKQPFTRIRKNLDFIREKKTMKMFDKVHMLYQQGPATFLNPHTVEVTGKPYSARRIFICTGTKPQVPAFAGIENIDYLTNETIFSLDKIPASMIVIGGGAIACEMAQAFARLGSKVTIIIRGPRLMWREDHNATDILEQALQQDGVTILRQQNPKKFEMCNKLITMLTDKDQTIQAEKMLIATGRQYSYGELKLENAGVKLTDSGAIKVNKYLQTNQPHIYAAGDCNGHYLFSHAAMHQGMLALINSMLLWPCKINFKKFPVPWTVFTEPEISHTGSSQTELDKMGIRYEVTRTDYSDYGAAIAETVDVGFVKAFTTPSGKILGVYIVGEGSGNMINEWSLAIQKKLRIHNILMLQHSFPTMGFLTKRVSEMWMMGKMKSCLVKKICQFMYRL